MFDLNDEKEFGGMPAIFNGGVAGLVKNVEIDRIEKGESGGNQPPYKVFYKDAQGNEINQGWFYFKPYPGADDESVNKSRRGEISRIRSLGVAVLGKEYVFPKVNSVEEALDVILEAVNKNYKDKKFNIYVNYNTKTSPKQWLQLRKYNFIEPAGTEPTTLTPNPNDLMERLTPESDTSSSDDDWI